MELVRIFYWILIPKYSHEGLRGINLAWFSDCIKNLPCILMIFIDNLFNCDSYNNLLFNWFIELDLVE